MFCVSRVVPGSIIVWSKLALTVQQAIGLKTRDENRLNIRTAITDITFVFIFLSGFGFEYG